MNAAVGEGVKGAKKGALYGAAFGVFCVIGVLGKFGNGMAMCSALMTAAGLLLGLGLAGAAVGFFLGIGANDPPPRRRR